MVGFSALVVVSISWLKFQPTIAQLSRSAIFNAVRIQSSGYQCIDDVSSVTLGVISYAQCVARCIIMDGCTDLNVIDGETGGHIQCQLYISKYPLHYSVRTGCRAYQVNMHVYFADNEQYKKIFRLQ